LDGDGTSRTGLFFGESTSVEAFAFHINDVRFEEGVGTMRHGGQIAVLGAALLCLCGSGMGVAPPAPRPATGTREFEAEGFLVRVDVAPQVIAIDVPEDVSYAERAGTKRVDVPLMPTIPVTGGERMVSGALLAQKAKQFDDGLYAAVDLAAQRRAGRYPGKTDLLTRLARALAPGAAARSGNADTVILAACRLGGVPAVVPKGMEGAVESALGTFRGDALRSKPIAFYTWSAPLAAIFRQDRMLQSELKGAAGIAAVARALQADPSARAAYEKYLVLVTRLTNPLTGLDLRGLLAALDAGRSDVPENGVAFFPASRAHETDLVMKLYGNRPIPEGFNLMDELIRGVRTGAINLAPTAGSGWYDYQTWSLEPLVAPERAAEAARLTLSAAYRRQLEELFRGVMALTRETHIKQLEVPAPTAAPPGDERQREPVTIVIRPALSAEPLATGYARRGAAYRFVRSVLEETFGAEALNGLHRQTPAGPVTAGLAAELDTMEALFAGASAAVSHDLGMAPPVATPPHGTERARDTAADRETFLRWAERAGADPDLGRDVRMMVPVFFDRGRGKTKVWVFLGWSERPVTFSFARPPAVAVTRDGRAATRDEAVVAFWGSGATLAYPVTAEVYVERILNRDEFRAHCSRYKTPSAILGNLK
jgi:hypothetical protein